MAYHVIFSLTCIQGASSAARSTVSHALSSGLFVKLQLDRKVELCKILLELVQQGPESVSMP